MKEIKNAKLEVTTTYYVNGLLSSFYEGPAGIHDEICNKKFTDKAKAEAFCAKQDWLKPKQKHISEKVEIKVLEYL